MSNVRRRVSQRAIPKSLSASALRTWATPLRAARPLASGALPEPVFTRAQFGVPASRETYCRGSFHSRSQGVTRCARRAAWSSTVQVRGRSPLPCPVPSVSALMANQSTARFGGVVGLGVFSVASTRPPSTINAIFAHPGSPPNHAINRTASGSRLSPR